MRTLSFDPYNAKATHQDDINAMLRECDVVSVHAIVTPETEGMIGAEQFAAMKPGAIYINSARAMLHDTDALVASLQSGHLGGAGLDHFKGENLPTDHPLTSMTNVVLTPHIGGATHETLLQGAEMIADEIVRFAAGEPLVNVVNRAQAAA
jgi:D-3-phosphoglycerate dehydrogenase